MQTGFVGLGAMGAHMARNLHRAGLLTGVWNRTPEKAKALAAELKVLAFANLTELGRQLRSGGDLRVGGQGFARSRRRDSNRD